MSDLDIQEIQKIIIENGNSFHYKVVDLLRKRDWYVLVSPYYTDNVSDKAREIDIIAKKNFQLIDFLSRFIGTVNVQLYIECKYIKDSLVFWFDNINTQEAQNLIGNTMSDAIKYSPTRSDHHYLKHEKVAKLFASSQKEKNEEKEPFYKAVNQSLNAIIAYDSSMSILPDRFNNLRNDRVRKILKYPIILCNSFENFYKFDVVKNKEPEIINGNFLFETHYAYLDYTKVQQKKFFLIDVCSFDTLPDFLDQCVKSDIGIAQEHIVI